MSYIAHSARDCCPEQSYQEHIQNVYRDAVKYATETAKYSVCDGELLCSTIKLVSLLHDLGKLHRENQEVLHQKNNYSSLPIHHQDAGVALLKKFSDNTFFSQMIISSHHSGLPDIPSEYLKKQDCFRDNDKKVRDFVNKELDSLSKLHKNLIPDTNLNFRESSIQIKGDPSILSRILLSCLADADHSDTARHYKKFPQDDKEVLLMPEKRLERLNNYVKNLGDNDERSQLRMKMYKECCACNVDGNIVACNSPVGSGKTMACMAHMLRQAIKRKSRRIFVILPYTNIIQQSVEEYRKALVMPDENSEEVVAELHHHADFENEDVRALTAQWRAPIIITTAVAFFETLSSNKPSTLRRLHQLPGSIIMVDEAHAVLPVKLLPITWHWIQILADEWKCYWLLASGSLVEFWKLKEVTHETRKVPQIIEKNLRNKLMEYENNRIKFCYEENSMSRLQLIDKVISTPGPRLLIMNTVQNAAVIANDLLNYYGKENNDKVLHLSTALNENDKQKVIFKIKRRLKDKEDTDWTLVATSCVEAGVNFSFKTGFREISSLLSLLQAAGRINRNGLYNDAEIWSFTMQDDSMLTKNKSLEDSAYVLKRYFQKGKAICPELSTQSIQDELQRKTIMEKANKLLTNEKEGKFPEVQKNFQVIEGNMVLVVADENLKKQLKYGGCDWKVIQRQAISIRKDLVDKLQLKPLIEGVYNWNLEYDDFLGIMKGLLSLSQAKSQILIY